MAGYQKGKITRTQSFGLVMLRHKSGGFTRWPSVSLSFRSFVPFSVARNAAAA